MLKSPLRETKNGCYLQVFVSPGYRKNQIISPENNEFRIKIAAPPSNGRANKELVKFLAKTLNINRQRITIIRGHSSRHKSLFISSISSSSLTNFLKIHSSESSWYSNTTACFLNIFSYSVAPQLILTFHFSWNINTELTCMVSS